MKVSLTSDWHFEFYDTMDQVRAMNTLHGLDCALNIVAGDVHSNFLLRDFFQKEVPNCFMIRGNHDFYGQTLEKDVKSLDIQGVTVLGCTLWTSFADDDSFVKDRFRRGMADYYHINFDGDMIEEIKTINKQNFELIMDTQPDIVVTHHCPTLRSIHPIFADDTFMNPLFSNDYEKYLQDTKIKYWVFGHTHWRHKYEIGSTKFICNPRGYPGEIQGEYAPYVFEI